MTFRHIIAFIFSFGILLIVSCTDGDSPGSSFNWPPAYPANPTPSDGMTGQPRALRLSWTCDDLDSDSLTYDIYFGTTASPPLVDTGRTVATYQTEVLNFDDSYYWKVVVKDGNGHILSGPLWSFSTRSDSIILFPDPNLEARIREITGKPTGDLLVSDVDTVTSFEASFRNISDLSGIEYMTGLAELYLGGNTIDDLSPLSNLRMLTGLNLYRNNISDLSPLSSLTTLIWLSLGNNNISDLSPLSSLIGLTWLRLDENVIDDLSPLSSLTSIFSLNLSFNKIKNLSPLSDLTALLWLNLIANNIDELSPLENLTALKRLDLFRNEVNDILPLVNNPGMDDGDELVLPHNPLNDISIDVYIPELRARGVDVLYW